MKSWLPIVASAGLLLATPALVSAHAISHGHGHSHAQGQAHAKDQASKVTSLTGTLAQGSHGRDVLTVGTTQYTVRLGPPWYVAMSPLQSELGQTVTLSGKLAGRNFRVQSMNGTALRSHGKPPWAGAHHGSGN